MIAEFLKIMVEDLIRSSKKRKAERQRIKESFAEELANKDGWYEKYKRAFEKDER